MSHSILRFKKLKGAALSAAGRHDARTRDAPNADPERTHLNRIVIGDDRAVKTVVEEMIRRYHPKGKPRKDSVAAVEFMLTASPEHFLNASGEIDHARLDRWVAANVAWLKNKYADKIVKVYPHLDEKTPHLQGFMVPIDARDRLNAKHFFDGGKVFDEKRKEWVEKRGQKVRELQDDYAVAMEPLGLERGIKGSIAHHQELQRFYGAINREVRLRVAPERVPDPPRVMVTEAGRKGYKQQVTKAVSEQLLEPINDIYKQAQLTREEKRKREAAERRAEESERRAERQIAEAKRREDGWAEKYLAEQKENIAFHQLTREYAAALEKERTERGVSDKEVTRLNAEVKTLSERVRDISLIEVMRELGYRGEQNGKVVVYQDAQGRAALTITEGKVMRGNEIIARNAVDLVLHVREAHERMATTPRGAIAWLAEKFSDKRAVSATLMRAEQQATTIIREHERSREVELTSHREHPQREAQDGRSGF